MHFARVGTLLLPLLLAGSPVAAAAQTVAQKADALRRRGTVAELRQAAADLERMFRLVEPNFRQEFANRFACDFTVMVRVGPPGATQVQRVAGDGAALSDRFEVVKNDTTGLTGLRVATRDGMPVLNGLRDGQRPEELTGFTLWAGRGLTAFDLDARRALLTRYIDRCHKYF